MTIKEQTLDLCSLLNEGIEVNGAALLAGLEPEDLFGEDGLAIDDPDNTVIDVGWDEKARIHYQLRKWDMWEAFERHTLTVGGKPIKEEA